PSVSTAGVAIVLAALAIIALAVVLLVLVLLVLMPRQVDVLGDARHTRLVQDEQHVVARHSLGRHPRSFDLDAPVLSLLFIHLEGELDVPDPGREAVRVHVGPHEHYGSDVARRPGDADVEVFVILDAHRRGFDDGPGREGTVGLEEIRRLEDLAVGYTEI